MRVLSVLVFSALLGGCAIVNATRVDSAGVPVKSEDGFQSVDLALALNPTGWKGVDRNVLNCIDQNGRNCRGVGVIPRGNGLRALQGSVVASAGREDAAETVERLRLESAYYAFYHAPDPGQKLEDRRNRVQQRLIGASDMNCGIFTQRIYGIQATGNFTLGSLATSLGGAGAIVTHTDTARLLSGLSAITSGLRAELNEDFFRKQWIEALVKAIENERTRLRDGLLDRAQQSISDYPVEAAVADAIRYNDACSLVSGLKEVNRAVAIADDPAGLRAFREVYGRAGFEANISATVNSTTGATTTRMRPTTSATASLARIELARDVAEVRMLADETIVRIKGYSPPLNSTALDDAATKIKNLVATLYGEAGYGPRLTRFDESLKESSEAYASLSAELAKAVDEAERNRVRELMRANDAAAEVLRKAAADAVGAVGREIVAEADRLAPTPETPPTPKAAAAAAKLTTAAPTGASAGGAPPNPSPGAAIDEAYRALFAECDRTDKFGSVQFPIRKDGKILWFGCKTDPSKLDALTAFDAVGASSKAALWRSKLGLDLDGSWIGCNKPGYTDQCETSLMLRRDASKPCSRQNEATTKQTCIPIDSDLIPYVVIPAAAPQGIDGSAFRTKTGVGFGDYGVVVVGDRVVPVVVADGGPAYKIGEGSLALLRALGLENCAARNSEGVCTSPTIRPQTLGSNVTTIIFPGTRDDDPGMTMATLAERTKSRGAGLYAEYIKSHR